MLCRAVLFRLGRRSRSVALQFRALWPTDANSTIPDSAFSVSVSILETSRKVAFAKTCRDIRFYWDSRRDDVSRLYGAIPKDAQPSTPVAARRFWIVLDPTLRVLRVIPFASDGGDASTLFRYIEQLPPPERFAGIELQAPILFLPNVFEPEFCRHLIDLYETHGGEESGFIREVGGKTVVVHDHAHKRRKDYIIEDADLKRHAQTRVGRRINPEILKIYSFKATRMERYIVSCYSAEDGGHFRGAPR